MTDIDKHLAGLDKCVEWMKGKAPWETEMENITGEKSYPIFTLILKWKEVKNGVLIDNSCAPSKMFRRYPHQIELDAWVEQVKSFRVEGKKAYGFSHEIKFTHSETWVLTWFQHETFDIGQSDEEALSSFLSYVNRHRYDPINQGEDKGENLGLCLMGAEDEWRWTGSEPSGDSGSNSSPPCRCKFCKEQGLIRIGH